MRRLLFSRTKRPITFESYGVRVAVTVDDTSLRPKVEAVLPENRRDGATGDPHLRFALQSDGAAGFDVISGASPSCLSAELDVALAVLETQVRNAVAFRAREGIFVHAGVVAHEGRAVLVPGPSFSGKTTLVAGLVRAGAQYLSDEYAVVDPEGLIHPYPKPLSLRDPDTNERTESRVESLGGAQGEVAVPVGLILVTSFRPGAEWRPERRSAGQGALALLKNTIASRVRPAECMRAVRAAAEGAIVLEGERGDAREVAPSVLASLAGPAVGSPT